MQPSPCGSIWLRVQQEAQVVQRDAFVHSHLAKSLELTVSCVGGLRDAAIQALVRLLYTTDSISRTLHTSKQSHSTL